MKIQYASDLHLEMPYNKEYWYDNKIEPVGDILILAGDISKLSKVYWDHPLFDQISQDFEQVFIVPGNHDYYHITNPTLIQKPEHEIELRHNVKYYNNKHIVYNDVNFIFSTLWSYIPSNDARNVVRGVACFENIQYGRKKISVDNWNKLHSDAKYYIIKTLSSIKEGKTVIATHHVPTKACVKPEYQNSSINSAFATELSDIIKDFNIDYWIYGHSHGNIDVEMFDTKIVSNQFGYIQHRENFTFDNTKYFEI